MRQHVNPLSITFNEFDKIPSLIEIFAKRINMLSHTSINLFLGNNIKMHNIHNYDNSKLKSNSLMFNYYVCKKKKF